MNLFFRQLAAGFAVILTLVAAISTILFAAYPLDDWSLLWKREVFDIPFLMFLPLFSIGAAFLAAVGSTLYWRKQFKTIEDYLLAVEHGHVPSKKDKKFLQEVADILSGIEQVQKQLQEQTKISQKLAKEKAEELDKRIEELVFEERQRLARELHDSVSQQLFAASMLLSAIIEGGRDPEENRRQLKLVEKTIQQAQLEMRALLLHLRPAALKGKSLKKGIEELLVELSQKVPIQIRWKVEDLQINHKGVEDHLFRILQEAVSNTLRHSKASAMEVLLVERDGFIILRVTDDGEGFDVDKVKTASYGLQNMRERAREIGGTWKMVSSPGMGTKLEVRVPIVHLGGEKDD
ncbi:sensor histidine kinase [Caldibacillus debilis]|jgi:NarL family two-component system sensor histidine kinase LiaS|uniref:sensor histidine kinase n=1 Tax=Caldibacillus debilis TaxID=301148 RepID=UPI001DB972AF|nr:sensor histidine kinase [Bacillaceae bacterium]